MNYLRQMLYLLTLLSFWTGAGGLFVHAGQISSPVDTSTGSTPFPNDGPDGMDMMEAAETVLPADIMLVVDNSVEMQEAGQDGHIRSAILEFISMQEEQNQIGMVFYTDKASVTLPLTAAQLSNRHVFTAALENLEFSSTLSDSATAIERACYELRMDARPDSRKYMLFLSASGMNTGDPANDATQREWLHNALIREAVATDTVIYGIALSDQADLHSIQLLSRDSGGAYFRSESPYQLAPVLRQVQQTIIARDTQPLPDPMEDDPTVFIPDDEPSMPEPEPEPTPAPMPTQQPTPVPSPQADDGGMGWLVWLLALLAIAGGIGIYRMRNGRLLPLNPPPAAILLDNYGNTNAPDHPIVGRKPVVLGRMAGKDTYRFHYIVVRTETVGRRHAMIEFRDGVFWLCDQGSINGTFLNDVRIERHPLRHGDRIRLHTVEFEFRIRDEATRNMHSAGNADAPTIIAAGAVGGSASIPEPPTVDQTIASNVDGMETVAPDENEDIFDLTGGMGDGFPAEDPGLNEDVAQANTPETDADVAQANTPETDADVAQANTPETDADADAEQKNPDIDLGAATDSNSASPEDETAFLK